MNIRALMPEYVIRILTTLNAAGYPAYAVGGSVRDCLMGRTPHDWDITTAASPSDVQRIFDRTVPTGEKYGTVTVFIGDESSEVTTFRQDGKYLNNRAPENVNFVGDVVEDLARRDFTVNAMAASQSGEITDVFGGREDIRNKLIRCVGEPARRFNEDALRMLRAVRFSAQLGFEIEPKTLAAIKDNAGLAAGLSAERVRDELEKTLCSADPRKISSMIEYGLLSCYMTQKCKDIDFSGIADLPQDATSRWCVFAILVSRPEGIEKPGELLAALRLPAKLCHTANDAGEIFASAKTEDALRLALARYGEAPTLYAAAAAEAAGEHGKYETVNKLIDDRAYVPVSELKVSGDDVRAMGFAGRSIGKTLEALSAAATLGKISNERSALIAFAEEMRSEHGCQDTV